MSNSQDTDVIDQSILNKSRKDKFLLIMNLPTCMRSIDKNTMEQRADENVNFDRLQFSVWGTVLPNISVPSVTVPYGGQNIAISSHARPAYPEITVNFNIDNKFYNYWVIWKWLNILNDAKKSGYDVLNLSNIQDQHDAGILNKYTADFSLFVQNEYKSNVIEFVYKSCLPTNLGSVSYDYKTTQEIDCYFTFSFWQIHPTLK